MFEADITKVVEEISIRIKETEEDFILDTIFPYCQETLQRKINKAELKQIILRGSRPKGKWLEIPDGNDYRVDCSICGHSLNWLIERARYCPNCGAEMSGEEYAEKSL